MELLEQNTKYNFCLLIFILRTLTHMFQYPSMQKEKKVAAELRCGFDLLSSLFCTLSFSHMKPLCALSSAIRTYLWAFNYNIRSRGKPKTSYLHYMAWCRDTPQGRPVVIKRSQQLRLGIPLKVSLKWLSTNGKSMTERRND